MSRVCEMSGKKAMKINPRKLLRGNLNPRGPRFSLPNLQTKKINGKRVKISTSALRTLRKHQGESLKIG
ncbi:MAG: 50S ribosomal protein L28 [Parcubacteria group bacterium]|nr:50S ribosomal protein L28 [Parcubacteria group bacterium]